MGDDVVWFWESSWVFGPGSSFFVWVRGMGGGTNGQSASGAAAGACLVRSFRRVILGV